MERFKFPLICDTNSVLQDLMFLQWCCVVHCDGAEWFPPFRRTTVPPSSTVKPWDVAETICTATQHHITDNSDPQILFGFKVNKKFCIQF